MSIINIMEARKNTKQHHISDNLVRHRLSIQGILKLMNKFLRGDRKNLNKQFVPNYAWTESKQ